MPVYVAQQSVLKEAGLWHRELGETPGGAANGSNKVFTVNRKPLADNNFDDEVNSQDVTVYVNGMPVTVSSVNEGTGAVTLAAAPADGAELTIDYSHSNISTEEVADVIEEAKEWVDNGMSSVVTTPYTTVPKSVRRIARTYAAGLLMIREYALQTDDEESKAGYRKLKLAESWMTSYKDLITDNNADVNAISVPRSSSAGRIFQRYDQTDSTWGPQRDENFSLNEGL